MALLAASAAAAIAVLHRPNMVRRILPSLARHPRLVREYGVASRHDKIVPADGTVTWVGTAG